MMMKKLILAAVVVACLTLTLGCGLSSNSSFADEAPSAAPSPVINSTDPSVAEESKPQDFGNDAQTYVAKGSENYLNNRDREAVEAFTEAIRLDPNYAEAYYKLGLAYGALGRKEEATGAYEKAVKVYKRVTRRTPKDAEAHFNMGKANSKLGDYDEAIKAYKLAVQLKREDSDMHYELGLAYGKVARYKEEVETLRRAVRLDPENYRAQEALDKAKEDMDRLKALRNNEDRRQGR